VTDVGVGCYGDTLTAKKCIADALFLSLLYQLHSRQGWYTYHSCCCCVYVRVRVRVCVSVRPCVIISCERNTYKSYERILMKFRTGGAWPRDQSIRFLWRADNCSPICPNFSTRVMDFQ